jgi:hypothetical protein
MWGGAEVVVQPPLNCLECSLGRWEPAAIFVLSCLVSNADDFMFLEAIAEQLFGRESFGFWNRTGIGKIDLELARLGYGLFNRSLARLKVCVIVQKPATGLAVWSVIRILDFVLQFSVRPRRGTLQIISHHQSSGFLL